uniref:Uncharacterized protein n=1 Tax=Anopheles dirus TaxID=7168 RepID=A0A182N6P3_9DIPT
MPTGVDVQQIKLPPNGTAIGIHMRAAQTCTGGSPENRPLLTSHSQQQQQQQQQQQMAASGHSHHHSHHGQHGQQQQQQQQQHQDSLTQLKSQNLKNSVCPPQLPHAAMSEMRV